MGIDYARLVFSYKELYMPKLQEVQNLKENRHCLALRLDGCSWTISRDNFALLRFRLTSESRCKTALS